MFTRIGSAAIKKDLTNTLALCKALGEPQKSFKCIHVAGTNGKGSTSHMLASILQSAGYKTGLYTSPHLRDFRERIRVNGKLITEEAVVSFVEKHKALFESIEPSFFEWTVALCFDYFKDQQVDIAIIETGLGGRLDSTNVIQPELSVITNIGWDHMDLLGDTLPLIAEEKAGIIKPNTPVVIGEYQEETFSVFQRKAALEKSKLVLAKQLVNILHFKTYAGKCIFDVAFAHGELWKNMECDLGGNYQEKNLTTVIGSILLLQENGFQISERDVREGLAEVSRKTGLMGRWQILEKDPLVICDTGHNVNGIEWVVAQIAQQKFEHLHMVIGMVKDKDVNKVLSLLPQNATYYFTKASIPRALDEKELQAIAVGHKLYGQSYSNVKEALDAAKKAAHKNDLIFIGGSTFIVAEAV